MNASGIRLSWLCIKQPIVCLKSTLLLGDLSHSGLLVPRLAHSEHTLALRVIKCSNCLRRSEEIELLRCPIELSQFLFPILSSIKVILQFNLVCALDKSLCIYWLRFIISIDSFMLIIDNYLISIFNTRDAVSPLVANQFCLSLDKEPLLLLNFHLFQLLTSNGNLSTSLTRHLKSGGRSSLWRLLLASIIIDYLIINRINVVN